MPEDRTSGLQLFSIGIVIDDKKRGSDQIKVYPVEQLPFVEGKVADHQVAFNVTAPNAKGINKSSTVKGGAALVATWYPNGADNRITPPDVIKNETVKIYRYADTDEYYWTTMFREPSLRRLETACWMFGDLKSGMTPFGKESSYWMEVSTHDQHVILHTSKSNGEPYTFDVILDTANGSLTIKDDVGDEIVLDAPSATISATNSEGAFVSLVGPDITFNAPGKLTMNAGTITGTSSQNTFNGTTDVNGVSNLNNGINVKGDNGSGKAGTITGDINTTGTLRADEGFDTSGTIHADGVIDSSTAVNAPNI